MTSFDLSKGEVSQSDRHNARLLQVVTADPREMLHDLSSLLIRCCVEIELYHLYLSYCFALRILER